MVIYDKVTWHIDGGENKANVIARFTEVFSFLKEKNLLSEEGKEFFEYGIDESTSLNSEMLNSKGERFFEKYYDKIIALNPEKIRSNLIEAYIDFKENF